jgi:hypothetical protein
MALEHVTWDPRVRRPTLLAARISEGMDGMHNLHFGDVHHAPREPKWHSRFVELTMCKPLLGSVRA